MQLGQYFAAIADYDTAIRLKPDDAFAYFNRGRAKVQLGQYFAAIADCDTTIRLKPDYALAYLLRGNAKMNLETLSGGKARLQNCPKTGKTTTAMRASKLRLRRHFESLIRLRRHFKSLTGRNELAY